MIMFERYFVRLSCHNKCVDSFVKPVFILWICLLSSITLSESGVDIVDVESKGKVDNSLNTEQSAMQLNGQFIQGGLIVGKVFKGENVFYQGKLLKKDDAGRFILGLDRDAADRIKLVVVDPYGDKLTITREIAKRDYQIQRIEGVKKQYVTPDPEQLKRSKRDVQNVVKARAKIREQDDFFDGFIWPAIGPISGVFGSQRVYNGEPRRPHYGIDVAGPVGTPIVAPAAGKVTLADDLFFSGLTLIVDHGHGLSSSFLHLSKMSVKVGDVVEQGQLLGEMGATGRVTGPHLDWRMNWTGAGKNVRIDPGLLVPPMPKKMPQKDEITDIKEIADTKSDS